MAKDEEALGDLAKAKPTASKDKEVNQATRDSDDALVCCVENTVEDRIINYGASFHATYCKEELERFKLCSVGQLDEERYHVGFRDLQWKVTKDSLVVAHGNKRGSLYMVEVHPKAFKGNVLDVRKVDIYFCKPSGLGKQKNISFIMSKKTRKLKRSCGRYNASLQVKCLKFGVAGKLSQTFRAESTGLRAEASNMLLADSARAQMKCHTAFGIHRVTSIVAEHGLSSKITKSLGGSSDASGGSKNSGSFEDSGRSDEKDSKEGTSSKVGGFETLQVRRSIRESRAPVRYSLLANYLLLEENNEPESYSEALSSKESVQWKKAIIDEIVSLEKNQMCSLLRILAGKKAS
nr:retrovirus-related Pol polyprotein from transposon TNT 1-94 [Tanacetum cinerariifolium]